jgi:hypothetical protein
MWIPIVIALAVFSPVIIWNYEHNWISFIFQYNHGTNSSYEIQWHSFFEFFFGQMAIVGPIFFFVLIYGLFSKKEYFVDNKQLYLSVLFALPMLFFLYKGLFKKMELNWIIPAYITGTILFSATVVSFKFKRLYFSHMGFCFFVFMILHSSKIFEYFVENWNMNPEFNLYCRFYEYKEAIDATKNYINPDDQIMSDYYTLASLMSYYLDGHPQTHTPICKRFSQYNIWNKNVDIKNLKGLFLSSNNKESELKETFNHVELIKVITTKKYGYADKNFYLYRIS